MLVVIEHACIHNTYYVQKNLKVWRGDMYKNPTRSDVPHLL